MTASVSASSWIAKPLEYARNLIALSDSWQTICSAANETAARSFISYDAVDNPDSFPHCVLSLASTQIKLDGRFHGSGIVLAEFYLEVPAAYESNRSNACVDHFNRIGGVIKDLIDNRLAGGTYLSPLLVSLDGHGLLDTDTENGAHIYVSGWQLEHHNQT